MTPKPLKNHRVQWTVIKKVVNGDGQRGAKPSKTIDANGSRGKKPSYPIAPKNDHCSPLLGGQGDPDSGVRVVLVVKFVNLYGLHGLNNQIIEKT